MPRGSSRIETSFRRPRSKSRLDRAHLVVLGVVGQLDRPKLLEERRQVHREPPPQPLLEPVPPAHGVGLGPAPGLNRTLWRRLLLVGPTQGNPAALGLQPPVQVLDRAEVVA